VQQPSGEVVVISIEKESSDHLNLPNDPDKWPRSLHGRLVDNLIREGAAVITFGVHFIEPRFPEDDQLFAEALKTAGNVVIGEPMIAKELKLSGSGGSQPDVHSIEKIVNPIGLFARSAVATAPFSWGLRKACWPIGKTASIRSFLKLTANLSAGWRLRQLQCQILSKIPP
jgi:hypothetical protein